MKPFKTAELGAEALPPKLASTTWVVRLLRRVLEKLDITSDDLDVRSSVPGHLSMNLKRRPFIPPFHVELSADPDTGAPALKVWPGLCIEYGRSTAGAWLHTTHAPLVRGEALTVPRFLPLATRVVLKVRMAGATGNAITPFVVSSTDDDPVAVPLRRSYGAVAPQNSEHDVVIAERDAGVITQIVMNHVRVSSHWNQVVASF